MIVSVWRTTTGLCACRGSGSSGSPRRRPGSRSKELSQYSGSKPVKNMHIYYSMNYDMRFKVNFAQSNIFLPFTIARYIHSVGLSLSGLNIYVYILTKLN